MPNPNEEGLERLLRYRCSQYWAFTERALKHIALSSKYSVVIIAGREGDQEWLTGALKRIHDGQRYLRNCGIFHPV